MIHPEFIIDFIAVGLLIYGFINEDKLIRVEAKIKRRIYKAICNYERRKELKK